MNGVAFLISEAIATPWAIRPESLAAIAAVLSDWRAGRDANADDFAEIRARSGARSAPGAGAIAGGIAVLRMHGVLSQRGDLLDAIFGGGSVSTEGFGQALGNALADPGVNGIVISVDSPGGSVAGVGELADQVYAARATKPVYAVADSIAASAAYWIASNASQMFITQGGECGSIGVFAMHTDLSIALESEGVKTTLISAGKFKTELSPFAPLSPDAKAAAQGRIDDYYGSFTRAVARGRGTTVDRVRGGMGQGRVVGASQALSMGMVDGVATLDQVVSKLQRDVRAGTAGSRSASAIAASNAAHAAWAQRDRDLKLSEAELRATNSFVALCDPPASPKTQAELKHEARARNLQLSGG